MIYIQIPGNTKNMIILIQWNSTRSTQAQSIKYKKVKFQFYVFTHTQHSFKVKFENYIQNYLQLNDQKMLQKVPDWECSNYSLLFHGTVYNTF